MSEIETKLRKYRKRVQLLLAWRGFALGAAAGACLSLILAVLDFTRIWYSTWTWLCLPVATGGVLGAILGSMKRVSIQTLAESIDRRASLQNRLGTANEEPDTFGAELREDALRHLGSVRPKEIYPVRMNRWHAVAGTAGLLAVSLFLLGNTPLFLNDQQKSDREELKQIGKTVERVAKPILDRKPEELSPESKELAKKFEQFSKDLEKGRMPKEEAMQKANELAKEAEKVAKEQFEKSDENLQKAQDALSKIAAEKAMEESGLTPEEMAGLDKSEIERGQQMGDVQRQQELDALAQKLSELERKLADGKDGNGEDLSQEQKDALKSQADALKKQMKTLQLSKKIKDFLQKLYSQPEFKELMEMMKKLQKINKDGKNGQLENPQLSEEQIKEMLKKLEELADKLGKDDKAMKEFLEKLKQSLKHAGGG